MGFDLSFPVSKSLRLGISPYVEFPPARSPRDTTPAQGLYRHFSHLGHGLGAMLLASYLFPSGTRLHFNLGLANWPSRYRSTIDAVSAGLGIERPLGIFTPFAELWASRFFESKNEPLNPLTSGYGPLLLTVGTKLGTSRGFSLGIGAGIPLSFRSKDGAAGLPYSTLPDYRPDLTLDAYLSLALIRTAGFGRRNPTGRLLVQVTDDQGTPLPGVTVELDDSLFHFQRTDECGHARFDRLPTGTKRVFVAPRGYEPFDGFVRVKPRAATALHVALEEVHATIRALITDERTGDTIPMTVIFGGEKYRVQDTFEKEVPPGTYRVHVSVPGFVEVTRRITVGVGEHYLLHVVLMQDDKEEPASEELQVLGPQAASPSSETVDIWTPSPQY